MTDTQAGPNLTDETIVAVSTDTNGSFRVTLNDGRVRVVPDYPSLDRVIAQQWIAAHS